MPWTSSPTAQRLAGTLQANLEFIEASRAGKDQRAC